MSYMKEAINIYADQFKGNFETYCAFLDAYATVKEEIIQFFKKAGDSS